MDKEYRKEVCFFPLPKPKATTRKTAELGYYRRYCDDEKEKEKKRKWKEVYRDSYELGYKSAATLSASISCCSNGPCSAVGAMPTFSF
jgi:hypothetical protein